jgi:hypothetical protein
VRTLRLCVCLLVLGTLFILGGCKKAGYESHVQNVDINNCAASPDRPTVHERDKVHWQASDHDYTIRFSDRNEPTANPFKVNHGGSNPEHPIRGHNGCDPLGHGEFYCKYSLTRDNESTPCADPGLHVIP